MPGANLPQMMDPHGNPVQIASMQITQNSNPYGQNTINNQYNPHNEFFTHDPNKHPYSAT